MSELSIDTTITEQDYKDIMYFNTFNKFKGYPYILIAGFVISVLIVLLRLIGLFKIPDLAVFAAVCFIVLLIFQLISTRSLIRRMIRKEDSGIGVTTKTIVRGSGITLEDSRGSQEYDWNSIVRGYELKNQFLFFLAKQKVIILPKSGMSDEQAAQVRRQAIRLIGPRFEDRKDG